VNFRNMIDVNNGGNSLDTVINQETYDDTTASTVHIQYVLRNAFAADYAYQNIDMQFPASSGHSYEFRTWYYAKAYISQFMVCARLIS